MFDDLKRSAGPPTRGDWNRLLDRLETLAITPGPGMLMRRTPSGTTLWPKKKAARGGDSRLQFKIYAVRYDTESESWKCKIVPGWVRNVDPDSDAEEPLQDWMPALNGVPLDIAPPDEPPELALEDGKTIFCRIVTNNKGIIEEEPTIVLDDSPQAGTHHQTWPENTDGEYFFPIADIVIADDKVTVTQIQQGGPILLVPNLPEHKNVGDKREIAKGRKSAGDTYDFRTLEQIEGDGVEIIEPLDPGKDAEDPIVAPDGTIITPGTPAVPPESEGDTIKIRRIDGRTSASESDNGSTKQIEVREREGTEEDADGRKRKVIEVVGNDFTESHSDVKRFSIAFDDGLVTRFLKIDDEEGDGWWGTVQWVDLATSGQILLTFKAGKLVEVFSGLYGVGVTQPGTEAAPGAVSLTF